MVMQLKLTILECRQTRNEMGACLHFFNTFKVYSNVGFRLES